MSEVATLRSEGTLGDQIPSAWTLREMGGLGEVKTGLTYKPEDVAYHGTLVLRSSNVQEERLAFDDNVFVSKKVGDGATVREGDILICVRNGSRRLIGKSALITAEADGMAFGAFMSAFRSDLNPYLIWVFQSDIIQRQIEENLGATINQITNATLRALKVPLPPLNEQQAIAAALSDADGVVAGLERLIAKKRLIKQGVMHDLLTARRRLPGFSGAWEVKKLGALANLYQPETISQSSFSVSGYPVFGANGVVGFFDRFNHAEPQLMVSCRGNCGTVNRTYGPSWITGNAMVINLNDRGHSGHFEFMFQLLSATDFSLVTTGSGQPQIVRGPLRELELYLPTAVEEQTAIAAILSDMDAEIHTLESRLAKARAVKEGMMQNLLTGRVRLV